MDGSVMAGVSEVLARFAYSLDDRDPDATGTCFTDDSTLQLGPGIRLTGRAQIQEFFASSGEQRPLHHFAIPHIVQESATAARATSHFFTFVLGQGQIVGSGRHADELVELDGTWFISRKTVSFFFTSPAFEKRLADLRSGLLR